MKSWFRFQGAVARRPYFLASIALLLVQFVMQGLLLEFTPPGRGLLHIWAWDFWARFPASLAVLGLGNVVEWRVENWLLVAVLLSDIAITWLLLALAVRRARSTGGSLLGACLVIVPIIQLFVILRLWALADSDGSTADPAGERVSLEVAFKGLLAGLALTVMLVAVSTLVLQVYGFGLFVASPFFVGCVTAFIGNRRGSIGSRATTRLVLGACFLGGVGQLAVALEGGICLVMAAPLIALMAWVGGHVGRLIALKRPRGAAGGTAMSLTVLPVFFAIDLIAPPNAEFESVESIDVAATDRVVWDAIVHMGPIPDPPIAPFRWGLAYPMSGTIKGTGIGAIREGVFSTGVAYERVTEWDPGRRLTFIVLSDPPTMRELSPYQNVNAPHVNGYFRTLDARFTITPLANGRTRLSLATHHELDLNPAFYWMPMAKWAVHANKSRVLAHFARQAETAGTAEAAQ